MTTRSTTTSPPSRRGPTSATTRLVGARRAARRHGAVKPMNFGDVFPVSGGLPLSKRAPQRQAYRLVELERWSRVPRHAAQPPSEVLSRQRRSRRVLDHRGATRSSGAQALALTGAVGTRAVARGARHRRRGDAARSWRTASGSMRRACPTARRPTRSPSATPPITKEAIDRGVFGAPTYVDRRRNLLGTGPIGLRRPKTGKIACFPGRPPLGRRGRRTGGSGTFAGRSDVRNTRSDAGRATGARTKAPERSLSSHFSGSNASHVHRTHLRARVRGGGDRRRHRTGSAGSREAGRQPRMQEIAAAIQAGAKAYLNRQYRDDRHRRRHPVRHHLVGAGRPHRRRLRRRRDAVRPRPATSA